ncbi:MAG: magnesium transporter CorA family protein [Methanocalculaceae archaeon]|jgi:magnesium transporter|nr:magnesium transporter CorA family protein [Methanocalculaceae archaeon]
MLEIYKTLNGSTVPVLQDTITSGCWVRMVQPTEDEISQVCTILSISRDDIIALMDEDEKPRVEHDGDRTLVIIDTSYLEEGLATPLQSTSVADIASYRTLPSGFIFAQNAIVTVSLRKNPIFQNFVEGKVKNFSTEDKTKLLLQFLYLNAKLFVQHLQKIDDLTGAVEQSLYKATENEELFKMLRISKSLVYITTALKANETVLEKLSRSPMPEVCMIDGCEDFLEDALIENRQAIAMADTYSRTLGTIMDTYASIINNNVNSILKLFTAITILLALPTLLASYFGMNVCIPWQLDAPDGSDCTPFFMLVGGSLSMSVGLLWLLYYKKIL